MRGARQNGLFSWGAEIKGKMLWNDSNYVLICI
jgi:hypothetical protein